MKTLVLTTFISVLVVPNVLASPSVTRDESPAVGAPSSTPLLGGGFVSQVQCAEDLKCCPVPYLSDYLTCQTECADLKEA
ncbi:uncharacterized protein EV420DRAFT_1643373 [Desarmillaria tabescens]|uniref:Uncharacterized protein n=1 Tax=Armillaria tabescens TaxID=1929756 RepID=A0AA39N4P4_ARMTA|nr:uncharacterized protein EV420DRAFT_1643373 [Desarmillaria tabescens]KAK0458026.1 hypothetical protein EV420DRAFT_1643373 [Desarmillaria tabescens]